MLDEKLNFERILNIYDQTGYGSALYRDPVPVLTKTSGSESATMDF